MSDSTRSLGVETRKKVRLHALRAYFKSLLKSRPGAEYTRNVSLAAVAQSRQSHEISPIYASGLIS